MSNLTEVERQKIIDMPLEAMLRKWRFTPSLAGYFQGDRGDFFSREMDRKRKEVPHTEWAAISRRVGWRG